MAETVLAKMSVQIAANVARLRTDLKGAQSQFSSFISNVTRVGSAIGIAFGIQQVASFALEVSKLAGEAEGVRNAFERLPDSARLMERLKDATHGTVSELELMKRAVQASNFDISLEALPRLLEFATLRAQQTGQSVDYLVDSIVTGIGRKSKLILDNLGISAVQLTEALGGASAEASTIGQVADAVGKIAEKNLANMADFSDNASSKIQQLNAEFTNFKVALGTSANETGILGDALDDLILIVKNLTTLLRSDAANALEGYIRLVTIVPRTTLKAANAALEYANQLNSLETAVKDFNEAFGNTPFAGVFSETEKYNEAMADLEKKAHLAGQKVVILSDDMGKVVAVIKPFNNAVVSLDDVTGKTITTIETLSATLKELTEQFRNTDVADRKRLETTAASIIAIRTQIEELEKLLKLQNNAGMDGLREKLAQLNAEFEKTDINDKKRLNAISQEIRAISALIDQLEKLRKKRNEDLSLGKTSTSSLTDQVLSPEKILSDGTKSKGKFDPLKTFFEQYQQKIQELRDSLTGLKEHVIEIDLGGLIGGQISELAFAFGEAAAGVGNFGTAILKSVIGFAKQLGEILVAAGAAMIAAKLLIKNPATAIAAGVALLAIAGAASAALNKSQAAFNSSGSRTSSGGGLQEIRYINRDTRIYVEGEFKLQNKTLVAAIDKQTRDDNRVKPRGKG